MSLLIFSMVRLKFKYKVIFPFIVTCNEYYSTITSLLSWLHLQISHSELLIYMSFSKYAGYWASWTLSIIIIQSNAFPEGYNPLAMSLLIFSMVTLNFSMHNFFPFIVTCNKYFSMHTFLLSRLPFNFHSCWYIQVFISEYAGYWVINNLIHSIKHFYQGLYISGHEPTSLFNGRMTFLVFQRIRCFFNYFLILK